MIRQILKRLNSVVHYTAMAIIGVLLLFFLVVVFLKFKVWLTYNLVEQFVEVQYVATPATAKLTTDNMYFVAHGPAESSLLELHKDGTYKTELRMHMGSFYSDEGTWSITDRGDIALNSNVRFHDIYVEDILWINVDKDILNKLPAIQLKLMEILKNTNGDMSLSEISKICKTTAIQGYSDSPVERKTIIELIINIDIYLKKGEMNVFYWKPITYKSFLFIINTEDHYSSEEKLTKEIINTIDNKNTKSFSFWHHDIFTAITPEYFRLETSQPEPFKFIKIYQ